MRYTICFGLRMRKNESLHTTTENKIGWENPEYDVRMVFSESTGMICMARKCQKAKYQRKNEHLIELVRDHTLLYNLRVSDHKDAQLTFNTCRNTCCRQIWWQVQNTCPMHIIYFYSKVIYAVTLKNAAIFTH